MNIAHYSNNKIFVMITVFYDGKCGLCSKEINHYIKIAPEGIFNWQDITKDNAKLREIGISLAEGLKLLHATDNQNKIHIGIDAFILIWKQLNKWHFLAKLISLPVFYQVTKVFYNVFANWRFNRLDHCKIAKQKEKS